MTDANSEQLIESIEQHHNYSVRIDHGDIGYIIKLRKPGPRRVSRLGTGPTIHEALQNASG